MELNIGIFFTAILAALSTFAAIFLVEIIKEKRNNKDLANNLSIFLKLELQALLKTLEKLKNTYERRWYFEYRLIDVLDKSVSTLEKARSNIHNLRAEVIQEKLLDLITDISLFAIDIRSLENIAYREPEKPKKAENDKEKKQREEQTVQLKNFIKESSTQKTIELIDIKRRVEDIIKEL